MYYFDVISLEGCPYSTAAETLLESKNINFKLTEVKYNEREMHKNDEITTFPQIYLKKKNSSGKLLVGGYDKLNNLVDILNSSTNIETISDKFSHNLGETFNKKTVLRLIELLTIRNT